MSSLKILKDKSYYSRFQVKWRRRREGKTDYYSRKRIICQDKRKYSSPKYRIVVRISKHNIICQCVNSNIEGDCVMNAMYSNKLKKFGISFGLTNFPCAYICGLLLSKKILKKKSLNTNNKHRLGQNIPKRIKAFLDIGLARTTLGHKVFACMKGIVDGGIDVPHSEKKYPGYTNEKGLDFTVLKHRIDGEHIYNYMNTLKEEDTVKFSRYFSSLLKFKMSLAIYKNLHISISSKILKDD